MHKLRNRQLHVWLLAGTGEGPSLARALLERGWQVSVSVVTEAAVQPYRPLPLRHRWVGALGDPETIVARVRSANVDLLVDATHPFATQVTTQLVQAVDVLNCPLFRFERPLEPAPAARVIDRVEAIPRVDLAGKRVLLALGARQLGAVVPPLQAAGAQLHARVLPTPLALRQAVAAGLADDQLALLRPHQGAVPPGLEHALCRHWQIDAVVCRQSGGVTEHSWHRVCADLDLALWLLRRPAPPSSIPVVHSVEQLLAQVG
ncbi:MAG: precorrin-6A/cobalt-precorrin-6A reductase [Synechococcus sp.]